MKFVGMPKIGSVNILGGRLAATKEGRSSILTETWTSREKRSPQVAAFLCARIS